MISLFFVKEITSEMEEGIKMVNQEIDQWHHYDPREASFNIDHTHR